jgi:hypothetical protein
MPSTRLLWLPGDGRAEEPQRDIDRSSIRVRFLRRAQPDVPSLGAVHRSAGIPPAGLALTERINPFYDRAQEHPASMEET